MVICDLADDEPGWSSAMNRRDFLLTVAAGPLAAAEVGATPQAAARALKAASSRDV